MTMHTPDWAIVIGSVAALTWFSLRTARYMRLPFFGRQSIGRSLHAHHGGQRHGAWGHFGGLLFRAILGYRFSGRVMDVDDDSGRDGEHTERLGVLPIS